MKISNIERQDAEFLAKKLLEKADFPSESSWLITGASGFIGTQLVTALKALRLSGKNISITILENGIRGGIRDWYFDDCNLLQCDVTQEWPKLERHDFVVHLASVASPVFYREFPLETLDANINGSRYALERAEKWRAKLLLISSSEIYGDPDKLNIPTSEEYRGNVDCLGPRACYDESKRIIETLAWIYQTHKKVDVAIARPFNFYGPGMRLDDGRVLPDLFSSIINNQDIVLHSDGTPTRTFCYISDAIEALILMTLNAGIKTSLNVGNAFGEISMLEVAKLVANIGESFGWTGSLRLENSSDSMYLVNNPQRRAPNTKKIKKILNWEASTSLESGLSRSITHFSETYNQ